MNASRLRGRRRALCTLVPGAIALVAVASPAIADVTVQPRASVGYDVNNNRNFVEDSDEARRSHGVVASVGLDIINRTPRGELRASPELRFSHYRTSEIDNETTDDQYLRVIGRYRWQTADAGFVANFARESLLTSELEDIDFPDDDFDELPPEPDTGVVTFEGQRQRIVLRPYVNWDYSERLSFGAEYQLHDLSFSGHDQTLRTDFTNHRVTGTANRNLSQLSTLGVQVGLGRLKSDLRDNTTDSVFGGLLYTYRWSERTVLEMTGGAERTDVSYTDPMTGIAVEDKSTGAVVGARLLHDTELARWRVTAGRSFDPDGRGFLRQRDEFRVNMERDLTQRMRLGTGARWVVWRAAGTAGEVAKRDHFVGDVGMEWRWTQTLTLGARAEYRYQDRREVPGTADALSARVYLTYQGLGPAPR